jgi:hypothetical protein
VQGCYIIVLVLSGKFFSDRARKIILTEVEASATAAAATTAAKTHCPFKVTPDSAFVWAYYTEAPAHLIDWARRRRSYHYLGIDFAIAALSGESLGAAYPAILHVPAHPAAPAVICVVLAATLLWICSACYLAFVMKRNVDEMELVWAYSRIMPEIRQRLGIGVVP